MEQLVGFEKDDHKSLRQIIEDMPATMEDRDTKYYSVFHQAENKKFHDQLSLKVCEKLVPPVEKLLQRAQQNGEIQIDDLQVDELTQEDKSKRIREFLIYALRL